MNPFLETSRTLIRFVEKEDEDFLFELNSDPQVMEWISEGKPNTRQEIQDNMIRILERRKFYQDQYGDFVAILKETNKPIGWFCLRPPHDDKENYNLIEIGWRLKKSFWKKGLATEVSKALLDKALYDYQAPVVFAKTMKGNLASQNVMNRLGLQFIRDFQESLFPGTNKDAVWYEIELSEK